MSKFEEYLNESLSRIMVFVDTGLQVGRTHKNTIVVQDMGQSLKVLDIGFGYETNDEQAKAAVELATNYNARVVNVWKTLFSHHVVQWIKSYGKSGLKVDHIQDVNIGSGYAADIGYPNVKSSIKAPEWQNVINKYDGVRSHLYCIYNYVQGPRETADEAMKFKDIDDYMAYRELNKKVGPPKVFPIKKSDLKKIANAFPEIDKVVVITKHWMPIENDWYGKAYQFQIDCKIDLNKVDNHKLGKGSFVNARMNYFGNQLGKDIAAWINAKIKPNPPAEGAGGSYETRTGKGSISISFVYMVDEH